MLSVTQYTPAYISACRARFNEQLSAYRKLVEGSHAPNVTTFERKFCRTLLLSLDNSFVDRNPDMGDVAQRWTGPCGAQCSDQAKHHSGSGARAGNCSDGGCIGSVVRSIL
jgi:hypothetical protein